MNMKHYEKARRFGSLVLATVVAILTLSVMVHATQVISTPNAAFFGYSLAPGANSGPVTPVVGQAVLVMGTQTAFGFRGVGHVSLLRVTTSFAFLEWAGLESLCSCGPSTITSGFSPNAGTHILFIDWNHKVDLQVANASSFIVHNGGTVAATGNVTMIW
jgi:hypothetical protein